MIKIIIHNIVPWKMPVSRKWWILCWEQLIPTVHKETKAVMNYHFIMEYWLLKDQGRIHQNGCSQRQALTSTRSSKHASDFFKMTRDRTTWGFLCSWCIRTAGCMRRTRWWTFCLRSAWPPQSSRPLLPPSEKPRDKTRTNRETVTKVTKGRWHTCTCKVICF